MGNQHSNNCQCSNELLHALVERVTSSSAELAAVCESLECTELELVRTLDGLCRDVRACVRGSFVSHVYLGWRDILDAAATTKARTWIPQITTVHIDLKPEERVPLAQPLRTFLGKLPRHVETLQLSNCELLHRIDVGSPHVRNLRLVAHKKLCSHAVSPVLQRLDVISCVALKTLAFTPQSQLQHLEVQACRALQLSVLPAALHTLVLRDLFIGALPTLPSGLRVLQVHRCSKLTLPHAFPNTLVQLKLVNCPSVRQLPRLPEGLVSLSLTNSSLGWGIPEMALPAVLPTGLQVLAMQGLWHTHCLPSLPDGLLTLSLDQCLLLEDLPEMPESLCGLSVTGCVRLKHPLPRLPPGLCRLTLECPCARSLQLAHCELLMYVRITVRDVNGGFPLDLPKNLKCLDLAHPCAAGRPLPYSTLDTCNIDVSWSDVQLVGQKRRVLDGRGALKRHTQQHTTVPGIA
jgi:hypothetical protein